MTKDSKLSRITDSASGGKGESMASETRKRAEELASELVGNVQFYETQERWGCFDIAKGWPEVIKAPHTKHGRLKRVLTASLVPKIEAALRLSEELSKGSEARPGVSTAVESNTADEKGLASRVEELEAGLRQVIAYLKQEDFAASYSYLSPALELAERALAGKKEK